MAAAAGNQLATLQELRTSDPDRLPEWLAMKVAARAAACADLSMLQWILAQQPKWTIESIEAVAAGAAEAVDAIDKITWLCQRFSANTWHIHYHFALASIKCGTVESLQWLASLGFVLQHAHFATAAAAAGQLGALRYLVEQVGCPWEVTEVRKAAVSSDSAKILEWASSADEAVWATTDLSELLAVAGPKDKLSAAAWLRAAGAEWPTSFLSRDLLYTSTVWPLRAMQWARANGCPWGFWDHTICTEVCSAGWHNTPRKRQATQDAMSWAHAAGCPCSSWQHRIAGRIVRKSRASSSSSSSSCGSTSSGSSSKSSSESVIAGDVYGDVDTRSSSSNQLFNQVFVDSGKVQTYVQTALPLLLIVLAALVVVVAPLLAVAL
jgi:hypothetical protein